MLLNKIFSARPITTLLLRAANVRGETMSISGSKYCNTRRIRYLTQAEAAALDQELFNDYKFSLDQLMELAGLSVAISVAKTFPPQTHSPAIIICGPGNNGGDGLVAARHMVLFGYKVAIYYPKQSKATHFQNLLIQAQSFGVEVLATLPSTSYLYNNYKVIVDALFGFSFKPPVKVELAPVMKLLTDSGLPVCSVDIPSGWDVERGPLDENSVKPAMLISLTAPKLCARPEILGEETKHFLGGRFVPPFLVDKYNLTLPPYLQQEQVILISC